MRSKRSSKRRNLSSQANTRKGGEKPFLINSLLEQRLASTLGSKSASWICRNIRDHATIENGFAVLPTIVSRIQTDDDLVQLKSGMLCAIPLGAALRYRRLFRSTHYQFEEYLRDSRGEIIVVLGKVQLG